MPIESGLAPVSSSRPRTRPEAFNWVISRRQVVRTHFDLREQLIPVKLDARAFRGVGRNFGHNIVGAVNLLAVHLEDRVAFAQARARQCARSRNSTWFYTPPHYPFAGGIENADQTRTDQR